MIRYTLFHNQDSMFSRVGTPEDTYIMGYSGRLYTTEGKISHILEHIFARHNADDRPDGKLRPSLSVGDVVVLMMDGHIGEPYIYSVAVFGFKELRYCPRCGGSGKEKVKDRVWHGDEPPEPPVMRVCPDCVGVASA